MGLSSEQNIPERKSEVKEKWTIRSLLGVRGIIGAVAKDFKPVELAFIFMLLITGLGELIGQHFTWMWYSIFAVTLIVTLFLRIPRVEQPKEKHADESR